MARRFPVLRTRRLVLREGTAKDAPWYFKHFNIWEIVDGQESPGPKDMKIARRDLKLYFRDQFNIEEERRCRTLIVSSLVRICSDPVHELGYAECLRKIDNRRGCLHM